MKNLTQIIILITVIIIYFGFNITVNSGLNLSFSWFGSLIPITIILVAVFSEEN
jgi:Na+-transporting NADH:ubiquinone oxidoreductase subunit NqrB